MGGTVELGGGRADDLGVEGRNEAGDRRDHRSLQGGVAADAVGIGGSTGDADHAGGKHGGHRAGGVIDVELDFTHVTIAEVTGDHGHGFAGGVVAVGGMGAVGRRHAAVDQQVIRVDHQFVSTARNDHVHAAQGRDHHIEFVGGILQVAHHDDGGHPLVVPQVVDLGLHQRQQSLDVLQLAVAGAPVFHDADRWR
ncbi:hypothetical protein D9M68_798740 [compost metagenome]